VEKEKIPLEKRSFEKEEKGQKGGQKRGAKPARKVFRGVYGHERHVCGCWGEECVGDIITRRQPRTRKE